MNVYLEAEPIKTTTTITPLETTLSINSSLTCDFTTDRFYAEIRENTPGRQRLLQLKSNCPQNRVFYKFFKSTGNLILIIDKMRIF